MKRILHLSDLHFGRTRPDLLDPLVTLANDLAPDLIAISGDFTQRARVSQFKEAAAFVARLHAPVLSVPGNHDTPIDNVWVRFVDPWGRYKEHICDDLEPQFVDDEVAIVGVNTVNRFSWQRGKLRSHTITRVCNAFEGRKDGRAHVVMLHHPLEHLPDVSKQLMRGARAAVAEFGRCGADIVLSGHLHNAAVAPLTAAPGVLFVQAGTGLSTRLRGEPNNFNLLRVTADRVEVDRYGATTKPQFDVVQTAAFERRPDGWVQST
jgi:3',5'-cyclic AMP phosphodiesterase CpdA